MKRLSQLIFRRRGRPLVLTVSWTDDLVGLVLWDVTGPTPVDVARHAVEDSGFGGEVYRTVVSERLLQGAGPLRETRWIVFPEAMPWVAKAGDSGRRAPQSLLECCQWLSADELPAETFSGTALLERGVYACHDFGGEGTGFCAPFGKRLLFVAKGNGERFCRLSRPQFGAGKSLWEVSADWLTQTLTLYRNKTGISLKRIRVSWRSGADEAGGSMAVPLDRGWVPVDWPICDTRPFDSGTYYLHQLAAGGSHGASVRIRIPELERRRTFWAWERRLRFLAMLLMAGWVFLFLGACQQTTERSAVEPVTPGLVEAYERQRADLVEVQARWRRSAVERGAREDPVRIVGRLAGMFPEGAMRRQVSVERAVETRRQYHVHASGYLAGPDAAAAVDRFVERVRGDPLRPRVENLKFKREGDGLQFDVETVYEYAGRTGP